MDKALRQSWPARLSAVGFILVVVFGNLWLVEVLLGQTPAEWIVVCFLVGTALALAGGLGLGSLMVYRRLTGVPPEADET